MRTILVTVLLVGCASPTVPARVESKPAAAKASTLDPRIDAIAREELDGAVAKWKATTSTVIVLDAASGAVLAVQGRDGTRDDPSIATARTFVTGSTLKTFLVAAALEDKVIAPDAKVDCATRAYGAKEMHDASPHAMLSIAEVLATSSNVGSTRIYDALGLQALYTWLRRFHFDDPPSHLPTVTDATGFDAAMLASGELAETTPMQMAAAYAVVVNGGSWVAPHASSPASPPQRLLRADTAATLLSMLEGVVTSELGTGKLARIEGHRVAGKTGTADHHGQYWASFAGTVLDAKKPFVVLVGLELPQSGGYTGASAAAPTFARIAKRIVDG